MEPKVGDYFYYIGYDDNLRGRRFMLESTWSRYHTNGYYTICSLVEINNHSLYQIRIKCNEHQFMLNFCKEKKSLLMETE